MQTVTEREVRAEIGATPTPEQLAAFYEKHGIKPDEEGGFLLPEASTPPVSEDHIIEHVRVNSARHEIPNLRGEIFKPQTMIFVAGGPSLLDHIEEIRKACADPRYDVYTSNNTCSWMLGHGMRPKYHVILDPTERKKADADYDADDITMLLGLQCHPSVFDTAIARKRRIFKFLAASSTRSDGTRDADVAREIACTDTDPEIVAIGGGSMAGTRMLYFANALGYRRIEYYGFDACISYKNGRVRNYAFNKVRNEAVLEVDAANGRKFFSTASFARQADEIVRLMDNLPGLEVVVHGDSFMSNQVAMYQSKKMASDTLISNEYAAMQAQMHRERVNYGTSAAVHASRVFIGAAQIVRKHGKCDILDYGCGKETLRLAMEKSFPPIEGMRIIGYDPGIPGKDSRPNPAQMVVCTDVLEHIEPESVNAVIEDLAKLTEHVAIVDVSLIPAKKTLPDGRNAHISLHPASWWVSMLKRYFVVLEEVATPTDLLCVLQPISRWMARQEMKKAA